jgi:uncharacterized protein YbbC (DUF1343 family)
MSVRFGVDALIAGNFAALAGQWVGLYTNLSAVDATLTPTYRRFISGDVNLVALFGPEHGLDGSTADGVAVASTTDASGIPVYSLYGATYAPTPEMLDGIDVLVCDIQDIGVRYYTYLWTMTHIMEACGKAGVPVMILDRPNPLGAGVDGAPLDPAHASLVGRYNFPIQYGMTMGEVATMVNDAWNTTRTELSVVRCEGYDERPTWDNLVPARPFVAPSPAMPHVSTTRHYPGSCLLEGTTLSEGRGTALPFEVVGAPYINSFSLAAHLNARPLEGATARPHQFTPNASKHAGKHCGGVQIHITDIENFRPITVWLEVIHAVRTLYPSDFGWLPPHNGLQHFDRLLGNKEARVKIDAGATLAEITQGWTDYHRTFREQRRPYLLYPEES